jgi:hypothetical protein
MAAKIFIIVLPCGLGICVFCFFILILIKTNLIGFDSRAGTWARRSLPGDHFRERLV